MPTIDLVTGFLGAGKTTFIRQYARRLLEKGRRVCILENDYGAVNIDRVLLKDLEGPDCGLEMVIGGDGSQAHRRRFRTKLIAMAMEGYDRVIVEPSGVYDTDEFFDTLEEEPLDRWYKVGNVWAILDPDIVHQSPLSDTSAYVLASEAADAGLLLYSRVQNYDSAQLERAGELVQEAFDRSGVKRAAASCTLMKPWDQLDEADWQRIENAGYRQSAYTRRSIQMNRHYDSLFYFDVSWREEKSVLPGGESDPSVLPGKQHTKYRTGLRQSQPGSLALPGKQLAGREAPPAGSESAQRRLQAIFRDKACGHVWRIKGTLTDQDGTILEINASADRMEIHQSAAERALLVVIGEDLHQEAIDRHWSSFTDSGSSVMKQIP